MTQQLKRSPAGFYDASNYFMRHFDGPCGLWSSACSVGHSYMPDSPEITLARATESQAVSRAMFIFERARLRSLTAVDVLGDAALDAVTTPSTAAHGANAL